EKGDFKLYYQKEGAKGLHIEAEGSQFSEIESEEEQIVEQEKSNNKEGFHQITSPMIGAFYSRPNTDSEPFVEVGSKIAKQDTVCVLEAMKLLNEIKSEVNGEIVEILAEDGQIIEFGQPLFTVKVSE